MKTLSASAREKGLTATLALLVVVGCGSSSGTATDAGGDFAGASAGTGGTGRGSGGAAAGSGGRGGGTGGAMGSGGNSGNSIAGMVSGRTFTKALTALWIGMPDPNTPPPTAPTCERRQPPPRRSLRAPGATCPQSRRPGPGAPRRLGGACRRDPLAPARSVGRSAPGRPERPDERAEAAARGGTRSSR